MVYNSSLNRQWPLDQELVLPTRNLLNDRVLTLLLRSRNISRWDARPLRLCKDRNVTPIFINYNVSSITSTSMRSYCCLPQLNPKRLSRRWPSTSPLNPIGPRILPLIFSFQFLGQSGDNLVADLEAELGTNLGVEHPLRCSVRPYAKHGIHSRQASWVNAY